MFISNLITWLNKVFSSKGLGDVSFSLGIEVTKTNDGLHLCKAKYTKKLHDKVQVKDSKPSPIPMVISTPLSKEDGIPIANATQYYIIVGAL